MDLEQEISKALQDPDIMNKIGSVLSSLGGGAENGAVENEKKAPAGMETNMLQALSSATQDNRMQLLLALKPFLSEKRAPYMDSAVTILKLAKMGKLGKDLKLF